MPHSTTEAEDRHSNFYDAWVNLVVVATDYNASASKLTLPTV